MNSLHLRRLLLPLIVLAPVVLPAGARAAHQGIAHGAPASAMWYFDTPGALEAHWDAAQRRSRVHERRKI